MPYYPQDIQQEARRSGLAAWLSTAAQAAPGYLGQGLMAGLGAQDEARRGVLAQYMQQQAQQEQMALERQYREAMIAQQQAEEQRRREEMAMRQAQADAEMQQAQAAAAAKQREIAQRQQIAAGLLNQLPLDHPSRPVAEAMAATGEIDNLWGLIQETQQRDQEQAYYQGQGIDPQSPIAKDLLEKKMGVNQPSQAATAYPQFYPSLGATFDPRTGTLAPVAGMPQQDRAWENAVQQATRVVMSDPLSGMSSPEELAQKIQATAAALAQVQRPEAVAQAAPPPQRTGPLGADLAAKGDKPAGQQPPSLPQTDPTASAPLPSSGGIIKPPASGRVYSVDYGGRQPRQVPHEQLVLEVWQGLEAVRRGLISASERETEIRGVLKKRGLTDQQIGSIFADARAAGNNFPAAPPKPRDLVASTKSYEVTWEDGKRETVTRRMAIIGTRSIMADEGEEAARARLLEIGIPAADAEEIIQYVRSNG